MNTNIANIAVLMYNAHRSVGAIAQKFQLEG